MRFAKTRAGILASLLLVIPNALLAENPFVTRFGGPYPSVDPTFKQGATQYGVYWMRTYSMLAKNALADKKDFANFVREEIDPRLNLLKPTTSEEERIKAAATYVKTIFESQVDSSKFTPEEVASIEAFMNSALADTEEKSQSNKLGFVLIRYQEFVVGVTLDQLKKQQAK